ncbi:unnamed protein product [Taenia asiatica]|uniref:BHLH domain-containing protein n=1 Tax=Taenia asiatica TaxID=60517 RepID=A0A0R3WD61_TAEAS|nr:unnamed protein product [Taenia asiatica]
MQHASLAAIGRRATIETQDSLSDSFENHSSRETSSQSPDLLPCDSGVASPPPPQLPRVLRLDEVLEHLRTVDLQLRALHTSRSPLPTPPPLVTSCGHESQAKRDALWLNRFDNLRIGFKLHLKVPTINSPKVS